MGRCKIFNTTHMAILAHCEKGLIVDVFGESPLVLKTTLFSQSNSKLIYTVGRHLKFLNLLNLKEEAEYEIGGISEIKQSLDGNKVCVLCADKSLMIFTDCNKIANFQEVEEFSVSDKFACFTSKNRTKIFSFTDQAVVYDSDLEIFSLHSLNSCVIIVTKKKDSQQILAYRDGKLEQILEFPQVFRILVKEDSREKNILLLIATEYTKSSYYADSILFLLKFDQLDQIKLAKYDTIMNNAFKNPVIRYANEKMVVISYDNIHKVHDFGFVCDYVYICFGDQPAKCSLYSLLATYERSYLPSIKNTVVFNKSGKKVLNAGFGNLPGIIEVLLLGKQLCSFESLGASTISWLNDNSRFMVATTNYFKSDNQICIYDYYGRMLEKFSCESLVSAAVYGPEEKEKEFSAPEKIVTIQPVAAYVPPHLSRNQPRPATKIEPLIKPKKLQPKNKARTIDQVEKELEDCLALRKRMQNGENLTLDEENKVFSIKNLEEELNKLKQK